MATRESIELDFRKAMSQADQVDQIADRLSRLSGNQFEETLQNLSAGWKGENARAYLAKGNQLQSQMNTSAGDLRNVASDIRRAARRIYEAEMAALAIAKRRKY